MAAPERLSAAWGSAGAISRPPQMKSLKGSKRLSAAWGSAGAISGPPQMKGFKELDGCPQEPQGDHR
jgi:hypothetical protein